VTDAMRDAWTCRYCARHALALGAFGAAPRYAAFLCDACGSSHALPIPPVAGPPA